MWEPVWEKDAFLSALSMAPTALADVRVSDYVGDVPHDELVKAMGMSGISKSQVSRPCAEIDERVRTFLERPIEGVLAIVENLIYPLRGEEPLSAVARPARSKAPGAATTSSTGMSTSRSASPPPGSR